VLIEDVIFVRQWKYSARKVASLTATSQVLWRDWKSRNNDVDMADWHRLLQQQQQPNAASSSRLCAMYRFLLYTCQKIRLFTLFELL